MSKPSRRAALAGFLCGLVSVSQLRAAQAQAAPQLRVRGRIAGFDGEVLRVAAREGGEVAVRLPAEAVVASLGRVGLGDLVPGTNLGVVAEPSGEGLRAVAVTILPATATRQFQSAWDLSAGSSMNNGAVAAVVQRADGHDLMLAINGRDVPVRIDAATALVRALVASRTDLRPGALVLVNAMRAADGALVALRVTVEKDGVAPPT